MKIKIIQSLKIKRELNDEEYNSLLSLWTGFGSFNGEHDYSVKLLNNSVHSIKNSYIFCLIDNNKVIGTITLSESLNNINLSHFIIHVNYRKLGLSNKLYYYIESFIRDVQTSSREHSDKVIILNSSTLFQNYWSKKGFKMVMEYKYNKENLGIFLKNIVYEYN